MPQKWVIAPYDDPTNEPSWGSTLNIWNWIQNAKKVSNCSPIRVAHWKFGIKSKMPKKWVIAANGDPTNEPPWGSTLKIETGAENIMPTPLTGGQEISFAPQMIFLWPPARGVGI